MAEKNLGGRPRVFDAEDMGAGRMAHVERSDDPSIVGFCVEYKTHKDTVYRLAKENQRLADAIKECSVKQEERTVRLAEAGTIPTAWAIFKMKQPTYGWSDRQEISNINLNVDADDMDADTRKAKIAQLMSIID